METGPYELRENEPRPPASSGGTGSGVRSKAATPASPTTAGAEPKRKRRFRRSSAEAPRTHDHLLPWLGLLVCLILAAVPLFVELGRPDVLRPDEARAVATSMQTWQDAERLTDGEVTLKPVAPRYNGEPALDRPPGLTWIHFTAFLPLDPRTATVEQMITCARAASVLFALLAVASVYWASLSIGGMTAAVLTGLVAATLVPWVLAGRAATTEMPASALGLFAIASALWAARPFKPPAALFRQALGWALCGVAMGLLVLVAGLSPLPRVLIPLAVVLAICPRRVGYVAALFAAVFIAALVVVPWAVYVHEHEPEAWRAWAASALPAYGDTFAQYGRWTSGAALWLVVAALPWTPWVLGGLVQPFSTSSVGSRQRLFAGWAWFVTLVGVVVALPPSGDLRKVDAMLLLPAGAMLVGQVFRQYKDLSDQGRHVRFWSVMRFPHVTLLLAASVCIPMALAQQTDLVADGWLKQPVVAPMGWIYWTGMALVLLLIAGLSVRFALAHHPARALVCWSAWGTTALGLVTLAAARGPLSVSPVKADALRLAELPSDRPIAMLHKGDEAEVDPVLVLYSQRTIVPLSEAQARAVVEDGLPLYLLTPGTPPPGAEAAATGEDPAGAWSPAYSLQSTGQRLWELSEVETSGALPASSDGLAQP